MALCFQARPPTTAVQMVCARMKHAIARKAGRDLHAPSRPVWMAASTVFVIRMVNATARWAGGGQIALHSSAQATAALPWHRASVSRIRVVVAPRDGVVLIVPPTCHHLNHFLALKTATAMEIAPRTAFVCAHHHFMGLTVPVALTRWRNVVCVVGVLVLPNASRPWPVTPARLLIVSPPVLPRVWASACPVVITKRT